MRQLFLAAILAAACAVPARAQQTITEGEFLRILDSDHPALRARSDRLGMAEAERLRAGALQNPTVEFWREAPDDNPRVTNWTLSWTPPLDGRRGPRVDAAEAGLLAAESDYEALTLGLRHELRASYAGWAIGAERQKLIRSHVDLVQRLTAQVTARADKGEESQLAVRRLELTSLDVRSQLVQAEAGWLQLQASALAWLTDGSNLAKPVLPLLPTLPESLGVGARPDLAAFRHEVEQAEQQSRASGRVFRFPELTFGWQQLDESSGSHDGPLVGVALSVPLLDRDAGDRYEAQARTSVARARVELATRRAEAELVGAIAAYERLRAGASDGEAALAGTDRVIESATAAYRLGENQLTDLLETLRSALAARLAVLDLHSAALAAHRDLEVAAGRSLIPPGGVR